MCQALARRVSTTARTPFDRSRTPLTIWFIVAWQLVTQKNKVSALSLQRSLWLNSYQTAWTILHRLRSAMVRPGRD